MLRLNESLEDKLIRDIEALRLPFPGSLAPSVADTDDLKQRASTFENSPYTPVPLGEGIGATYNRVPLTKESLDLMDTPIPSGVSLAAEFAYHGLAPAFRKGLEEAQGLLEDIYSEIKKFVPDLCSADNL